MPGRWKALLLISFILCAAVAVSQSLWRFAESAAEPGIPDVSHSARADATHYDLDMRLDVGRMQLALTETVDYTNTTGDFLHELVFQLKANAYNDYEEAVFSEYDMGVGYPLGWAEGGLKFSNVLVDGEDAAFSVHPDDDQALHITLPAPLAPNAKMRIEMRAIVIIPPAYGPFGHSISTLQLSEFYPVLCDYANGQWIIEPYSLMTDMPRGQFAKITGRLEAPADVIVTLPASSSDYENDISHVYDIMQPAAGDFAFAASQRYYVFSERIENTTVYVYALSRLSGQQALEYATGAFQALEGAFGPYPYANFMVAEVESLLDLRVYPGSIQVASAYFERAAYEDLRWRVALGLAQQWTGEMVDIDYTEDPWLSALPAIEAVFRHYYLETLGERAYNVAVEAYASESAGGIWGTDIPIASSMYDFPSRGAMEATIYARGYSLMRQMREMLGDAAYDAAMRAYLEKFAFEKAGGEDFVHALCGEDESLAHYFREELGMV